MKKIITFFLVFSFITSCSKSGTTTCVVHIYGDTTAVVPESRFEEDDAYHLGPNQTQVRVRKGMVDKLREGQEVVVYSRMIGPNKPISTDWIVVEKPDFFNDSIHVEDGGKGVYIYIRYKKAKLIKL